MRATRLTDTLSFGSLLFSSRDSGSKSRRVGRGVEDGRVSVVTRVEDRSIEHSSNVVNLTWPLRDGRVRKENKEIQRSRTKLERDIEGYLRWSWLPHGPGLSNKTMKKSALVEEGREGGAKGEQQGRTNNRRSESNRDSKPLLGKYFPTGCAVGKIWGEEEKKRKRATRRESAD